MIHSINPATGRSEREYPETTDAGVEAHLLSAHRAFMEWRGCSLAFRAARLANLAALLRERKGEYARLMAVEMGKPISAGRAEIEKCAWTCEHYAAHGPGFLRPQPVETDAARSYVACEPLGVVLALMPWNFPFWQVIRFAAPSLLAGNTAVLKHASNVPGCAEALEQLFAAADFPSGAFANIRVSGPHAETLIAHPLIAAVTLTGSVRAGRQVGAAAGGALKKCVLELGGSDPYIVLADADLERAAELCVRARMLNGGQSCIAAKRLIAVREVYAPLVEAVVERMRELRMGDPLREETQLGPLARQDLRDDLHDQVERSIALGAKRRLGAEIPDRAGWWYPPTVLSDVQPGQPAFDEELFGPVAALVRATTEANALELANASRYGLGACVITADVSHGEQLARQLEAGNCFVNGIVRSDPRLPFGGVKDSGFGRELGEAGIREFVNLKTVHINDG